MIVKVVQETGTERHIIDVNCLNYILRVVMPRRQDTCKTLSLLKEKINMMRLNILDVFC